LNVKVFADGADLASMKTLAQKSIVKGLTTNPTLMRRAGITDYKSFAQSVLSEIKDKPVSFEVFSDDFHDMQRQAMEISSWGKNVYVKIPVMNTKGQSSAELVRTLSQAGVKLNVTAIFTTKQIVETYDALRGGAPSNISVFAGRIADAGLDALPFMQTAVALANMIDGCEVIWASPREVYNVVQASQIGCHIITVTPDILGKLEQLGKDLTQFSNETVSMFYRDAQSAGFKI
jgi:transaldolase